MKLNKELQIYREIEDVAVYNSLQNLKNAVIYLDECINSIDKKIDTLAKSLDAICAHVMCMQTKEVKDEHIKEKGSLGIAKEVPIPSRDT